jgi:hypothetical protein
MERARSFFRPGMGLVSFLGVIGRRPPVGMGIDIEITGGYAVL